MKNKQNHILLFLLISLQTSFLFASIPLTGQEGQIRVYCFYQPKEVLNLEVSKRPAPLYKKLMKKDQSESVKIPALWQAQEKRYALNDENNYNDLKAACLEIIGTDAELVDIQATDASKYETWTYFYPLVTPSIVAKLNKAEADAAEAAKIDQEEVAALSKSIVDNPNLIKRIADKLKSVPEYLALAKTAASDSNAALANITANSIVATLFDGPITAGLASYLVPIVYQVLIGTVPGYANPLYWLFYAPLNSHIINWAFNNAPAIKKLAGEIYTTTSALKGKITGAEATQKLENMAN